METTAVRVGFVGQDANLIFSVRHLVALLSVVALLVVARALLASRSNAANSARMMSGCIGHQMNKLLLLFFFSVPLQ